MKRIYLIAILFFALAQANAQTPKPRTMTIDSTTLSFGYLYTSGDLNKPYLEVSNKNEFSIHGDTMEVVKMLYNMLMQKDSAALKDAELIYAGVDFLNHVPDYWKMKEHNCAWPTYWRLMQKRGFKQTKAKTPACK